MAGGQRDLQANCRYGDTTPSVPPGLDIPRLAGYNTEDGEVG